MRVQLIVLAALALPGSSLATPVAYTPPAETAKLAPGPDIEIVRANCSACHSVDYIITQPRVFKEPRAFWTAEVAKMKKVYGAPIKDENVPKIIDYLTATYGR